VTKKRPHIAEPDGSFFAPWREIAPRLSQQKHCQPPLVAPGAAPAFSLFPMVNNCPSTFIDGMTQNIIHPAIFITY
jgi:hypothetical protein